MLRFLVRMSRYKSSTATLAMETHGHSFMVCLHHEYLMRCDSVELQATKKLPHRTRKFDEIEKKARMNTKGIDR